MLEPTLVFEKQEIKTIKEVPVGINLTLTLEEAQVVIDLCSKVGGIPHVTTRKYSQSVLRKLEKFLEYNNWANSMIESEGGIFGRHLSKMKVNLKEQDETKT